MRRKINASGVQDRGRGDLDYGISAILHLWTGIFSGVETLPALSPQCAMCWEDGEMVLRRC
jgi:hypothetical protein